MSGFVLTAVLGVLSVPAFGDIFIICNPSVPVDKLERREIRALFLGKQKRWPDDKMAEVVLLYDGDVHRRFVSEYTQKTPFNFKLWWRKMLFTGKGMMPKSFPDEPSVMGYVEKTEGAIGYVSTPIPENCNLKIVSILN